MGTMLRDAVLLAVYVPIVCLVTIGAVLFAASWWCLRNSDPWE